MADNRLDALVYATFDHRLPRIAPDVMTKPVVDDVTGPGNNRRLSPVLGFPALTVPAGFTRTGSPSGLSSWAGRTPKGHCSSSGMRTSRRRGIASHPLRLPHFPVSR